MKKFLLFVLALILVSSGFVYYTLADNNSIRSDSAINNLKNGSLLALQAINVVNSPREWNSLNKIRSYDWSPKDKTSKLIILGTSSSNDYDSYQYGASQVLIVNGFPYFIDCCDSWLSQVAKVSKKSDHLNQILVPENFRYMFLTELDETSTIGLPSFVSSSNKNDEAVDKLIYGPQGIGLMVAHINSAWKINRIKRFQGFIHQQPDGLSILGMDINPLDKTSNPIFEDENVKVEAFRTYQGRKALDFSYAYRFTTKPDGRIITLAGNGYYGDGLIQAAKDADILVIGELPGKLDQIQRETGVKKIVLLQEDGSSHDQENIFIAQDGGIY